MFLLALEKIGVGMNFANVHRVVQYLCKGLTLVRWEQRHGRCARTHGMTGTGYIIAESRMISGTDVTVNSPNMEDPALLDLLPSNDCCDAVYNHWLKIPLRPIAPTQRQCCSRSCCYPSMVPGHEHQWIVVSPGDNMREGEIRTTAEEKSVIYEQLMKWRLHHWQEKWRLEWPCYGPKSLISDADLENVAKHAGTITSIDHLQPLTHIIHWSQLAEPLFHAVRAALALATGATAIERTTNNTVACQEPRDQDPNVGVAAAGDTHTTATWRGKPTRVGKLQQFKNVIIF